MSQVRRGLVVAVAAVCVSFGPVAGQSTRLTVQDAVTLYARGEFDSAVANLDKRALTVGSFTRALETWMATGDAASAPRRRRVAVAFALDATWTATRDLFHARQLNRDPWKNVSPDDPEHTWLNDSDALGRIGSWITRTLPNPERTDSLEHTMWLATIGVAEDGSAWYRVMNEIVPSARKRFPDEPRFGLADAIARTSRQLGAMRSRTGPFRGNEILRKESLPSSVTKDIPNAIRTFVPLLASPALAGEVELRIGYLELRDSQWSRALARFDAARTKATEPTLRAAADYFAGWVYEQQQQFDNAIAAYRRAIAITPTMRNLATRLSALLFLRNERTEAYAVLDPALNARPAPLDLLLVVDRADGRFVPEWLASIRQALQ